MICTSQFFATPIKEIKITFCVRCPCLPACSPLWRSPPRPTQKEDAITVTATALPAGSYSADTASTGSKTAAPIGELPQSVSVVTSQVIDDFQVKSVNDAMKFVSGVTGQHARRHRGWLRQTRLWG